MPEFRSRPAVEIARVGTFNLSTGPFEFRREHLEAAIRNAQTGAAPRLKAGHVDPRFDGEPAIGTVTNLRLSDDGEVLLGDYTNVPAALDDWLDSAYPGRSIEASATLDPPDLRITHVALLGVTLPGIDSLADLPARFGDQSLALAAAQDNDGNRITFVIASNEADANALGQLVENHTTTPKEESVMDPKQLREKLGLAEDASNEDVTAALDQLAARPEPDNVVPISEVDTKIEEAVAAARQEEREKISASGGVVVDQAALDALKADAQAGREARETQIKASRETFVDTAIKAGKFPPARREHFLSLMTADEDGTRTYIDSLDAGAIPVDEIKGSGAADEHLSAPTSTGWFAQLQEA